MQSCINVNVGDTGTGDSDHMDKPSKKRKTNVEDKSTVLGSRTRDHLSALPNEILCYILSFLTVRDSIRTRLLSSRWRYISDYRSVLHFDALNVLGSEDTCRDSYLPKFVRAADQFMEVWKGGTLSALKVEFGLGNKQASGIDRWVASGVRMKIEDMELNFISQSGRDELYVLSGDLLHSEKPYLKFLRLNGCVLTLGSGCTSWISHLVTLEMVHVIMNEKDFKCILSAGLNLTSLMLVNCCKPKYLSINVELPKLKKLVLCDSFDGIELNCPNLETLECQGRAGYFKFSHIPLLTKVDLMLSFHSQGYSLTLDGLARHAPKLQALSLMVMTEVQPLPANNLMPCLKRLDLQTDIPTGFDLFSITHLLKASPFLEILHLELSFRDYTRQSPQREYQDCPHFQLKEIKINGFRFTWNEMELAQYLLKNAVALQRMIIVDQWQRDSSWRQEKTTSLLQDIKTTAELVVC